MSTSLQFSPDHQKQVRMFAFIAAGLAVAHVIVIVLYYRDFIGYEDWVHVAFFDLDEEESFGTWFSAMILLYAGRLLLRRARAEPLDDDPWYRWWLVLIIGFHFRSID